MTRSLYDNICGADQAPRQGTLYGAGRRAGAEPWPCPCNRATFSREVLPVCSDRLGWLLRRSFLPIVAAAVVLVFAHLWANQFAGRRVVVIQVPTPLPWMCENDRHMWARCWWTEERISSVSSTDADKQQGRETP